MIHTWVPVSVTSSASRVPSGESEPGPKFPVHPVSTGTAAPSGVTHTTWSGSSSTIPAWYSSVPEADRAMSDVPNPSMLTPSSRGMTGPVTSSFPRSNGAATSEPSPRTTTRCPVADHCTIAPCITVRRSPLVRSTTAMPALAASYNVDWTVKTTPRPPGSAAGKRCAASPFAVSIVVSGSIDPPLAGMRETPSRRVCPPEVPAMKYTYPSSPQVPPPRTMPESIRVTGGSPVNDTMRSARPPVTKPTRLPSGEKNGWWAPSPPGTGLASKRLRSRTKSCTPCSSAPVNANRRPSGEIAMLLPKFVCSLASNRGTAISYRITGRGTTGAGRTSAHTVVTASAPASAGQSHFVAGVVLATATPGAATVLGTVKPTLVSASAKLAAVANRSAGILLSAFAIAALMWPGTVSRAAVTGGAFSVITFATIACAVDP